MSAPASGSMLGRILGGRYRLVQILGRGGSGTVFEAEDLTAGGPCAVKVLHPEWAKDASVAGRFAREAKAASSVRSEHIVRVVDAGTDGEVPYIAMELLPGEDLGTRLRRETRIPLGDALHVAEQVLRGLVAAHAAGVVHRDLKPDNVILVEQAGAAPFAKIVDFGMAKIGRVPGGTDPMALTRRGVAVGTPSYIAPEQIRSLPDVDARADVFSLGAVVFECLAGRPPHVGPSDAQVLLALCMRDAPDVRKYAPEVPPAVAAFVARALARERAERFSSAAEMLAALRALPRRSAAEARRAKARVAGTAVIATIAGAAAMVVGLAVRAGAGGGRGRGGPGGEGWGEARDEATRREARGERAAGAAGASAASEKTGQLASPFVFSTASLGSPGGAVPSASAAAGQAASARPVGSGP